MNKLISMLLFVATLFILGLIIFGGIASTQAQEDEIIIELPQPIECEAPIELVSQVESMNQDSEAHFYLNSVALDPHCVVVVYAITAESGDDTTDHLYTLSAVEYQTLMYGPWPLNNTLYPYAYRINGNSLEVHSRTPTSDHLLVIDLENLSVTEIVTDQAPELLTSDCEVISVAHILETIILDQDDDWIDFVGFGPVYSTDDCLFSYRPIIVTASGEELQFIAYDFHTHVENEAYHRSGLLLVPEGVFPQALGMNGPLDARMIFESEDDILGLPLAD